MQPTNRLIVLASILFLFCAPASALRSTNFEGYTDPHYKDYSPKRIVLLVANSSNEMSKHIEKYLVKAFEKRGVVLISYRNLFPPTRTWSESDQVRIYEERKIDSGLIVTVGARSSLVIPVATKTYGSTNIFGAYGSQGTLSANASTTSTTYNVMGAKSKAEFSAVLLDIAKNRTVWYADVTTKAGGTLFVGAKGDAKGLTKGIVKGLEEGGHLSKR